MNNYFEIEVRSALPRFRLLVLAPLEKCGTCVNAASSFQKQQLLAAKMASPIQFCSVCTIYHESTKEIIHHDLAIWHTKNKPRRSVACATCSRGSSRLSFCSHGVAACPHPRSTRMTWRSSPLPCNVRLRRSHTIPERFALARICRLTLRR